MRNKSAFTKPLVQNSFRKNERQYPQAKKLIISSNNQQNMQQYPIKVGIPTCTTKKTRNQFLITGNKLKSTSIMSTNMNLIRNHFTAQYPFPIPGHGIDDQSIIDQTCLWYRNMPNNLTGQRKRILQFRQIEYILSNWTGDQFPAVIYLCLQNFQGFSDINGVPTDRIVALQLQQLIPIIQSSIRTYDLKYVLNQSIAWQLPLQLTWLKISVKFDNQQLPIMLPLPNPISLNFQIRQQ